MGDILRLKAVGDIMLGDHPVCFGHGVRSKIRAHGFNYIFRDVFSYLSNSDILFGNLEVVLSDTGYDLNNIANAELRGELWYAKGLASVGFTVMSVANNHAMQHGRYAFDDTVNVLRQNDIFPLGLDCKGKTNCFILNKSNIEIAMLAYSLRPERFCSDITPYTIGKREDILRDVSEYKRDSRIVVVSLHWGEEYLNYPSIKQIDFAHGIIDAGANLILGHHPHVLQGIEHYKNGYIAYSLGNFIFDKWQTNPRETMILDCTINEKGIKSVEHIPVFINRNYQPQIISGMLADRLKLKMDRYTNHINNMVWDDTENKMEEYRRSAERAYQKFRIASYLYFIRNFYKYPPYVVKQSFWRFFLRRIR